jgi:hypothetical protein
MLDPRDHNDLALVSVAPDGVWFFERLLGELVVQKHQDDRSGKASRRRLHTLWNVPGLMVEVVKLI